MDIIIGVKGRAEAVVDESNTSDTVGSGTLPVFATPSMTALMENAAHVSIAPFLEKGQYSVGTSLSISHDSATPVGMKVWAESEVVAVEGRKIVFHVTAYDEGGLIGEGTHVRFIVFEKFLLKCEQKKKHTEE